MPRRPRYSPTGMTQHVIHRGANFRSCFLDENDYYHYLLLLKNYSIAHQVQIHAWVLLHNHLHLLATPLVDKGLSRMMQSIAQQYAQYFNDKYEQTGSLWGGRFQNCVIEDEDYLLYCYAYIENNPVRTGIVSHIDEYRWSSYAENSHRVTSTIVTHHDVYKQLGRNKIDRGNNYRAFLNLELDESCVNRIRQCTRRGGTI